MIEIPNFVQEIINSTETLSEKKLRSLLKLYRKKRDGKIKEQIINAYLWLVVKIAKKFYKKYVDTNLEFQDFIEEGIIGLLKAINRYKPRGGSLFRLYAEYWIKQSLQLYLKEKPFTIAQLPRSKLMDIKKWYEVWNKILQRTGKIPSLKAMAKELKMSYHKVRELYHQLCMLETTESLTTPVGEDATIEDFIEDKSASPEEVLSSVSMKEALEDTLGKILTRKEIVVIKHRYKQYSKNKTDGKMSYRKIARILHVSPEYVRKIEQRALQKLALYVKDKLV
ncbi:MAG: sigma-70 family RNA polymerase sigma factor [Endomicrobia bacterium]|nr:sigma-70 family RNA polymerase sigma factor [Endomicrobiia bacterium]MDW8055428.1 sigma-70 family RNA polymerase sigma factor [Elusimicrobiota bacterium]